MRIFLSAVSAQFKQCRDALASDLRAVGAEVVVQEDFQQQGRTLLEKLERYIASCDRVVALIGDAYGCEPDPASVPDLPRRSYSQWEYSFALGERLLGERRPGIDVYVYFASAAFLASHPVAQEADDAQRQKTFVAGVRQSGKDWNQFTSTDGLRALVLRDGFRLPSVDHAQLVQTEAALRLIPRPPLVGFISRHDRQGRDILARLQQELNPSQPQLVALWGSGGVGKTALAAQAARNWAGEFGSRVVWVAADRSADFTLDTLLDAIISQLHFAELAQLNSKETHDKVRDLLAQAPSLVVLDNFETVLPENQEPCVAWLADRASCAALLTTRDSLSFRPEGINLALNVAVDSMTKDEAGQFVERHAALADNPDAVAGVGLSQVIQAAEGNPLLMQLLVAQIGLAQSPETVLEQLLHGKGDAVERVFDRSFNLPQLGDDGRAALLALSLFVSGASRQALMEVTGFTNDLERLNEAVRRLAALRLLSTVGSGERLAVQGLTRELANARLAQSPRADDFRRRFVSFFLRCSPVHLAAEQDNLLAAIDAACGLSDWENAAALAAKAVGVPVQAFFRLDGAGRKQPLSETEYQKVGRDALASSLVVNDARRIPLQNDALWSKLLELGNPQLMEVVLRDYGVSFPFPSCADYLQIVGWAAGMSRLSAILVQLLSSQETAKAESQHSLKAAVMAVRRSPGPRPFGSGPPRPL
jgi:hypothetical protein